MRTFSLGLWLLLAAAASAADLPTLAGPAMGTTYRVTLAADMPGMTHGEVHRDVEAVLARIDRAASTWRADSDASRFNRAAAGEWVTVSADLVVLVQTARAIHERSEAAFDITVGPLVRLWNAAGVAPSAAAVAAARTRVGMRLLESRPATDVDGPALRKTRPGVEIDLSGIAPGYAVDRVGERLVELGSPAHLVELGGEVRAWGQRAAGRPWRLRLRDADASQGQLHEIDLDDGVAIATSTYRPGRSPIDPRTGRPVTVAVSGGSSRSVTALAASCAAADAWAVAALVLGLEPDAEGMVMAPSTPAGPTAARRAGP